MMISPREIRDSADALAALSEGYFDETAILLTVRGVLDGPVMERWCRIAEGLPAADIGTLVAKDSLDSVIDLQSVRLEDLPDAVTIYLFKHEPDRLCRLFFSSQLRHILYDNKLLSTLSAIHLAEQFVPFETLSLVFRVWESGPATESPRRAPIDPRRYVRDLTDEHRVPTDVGVYLLAGELPPSSAAFRMWMSVSQERLALTLINEIWKENGVLTVNLSGPRVRKIPLGTPPSKDDPTLFEKLHEAAKWVYGEAREIEVRHTLLTNELAREWPEQVPFYQQVAVQLPAALESAKTAYRVHIRDSSKETLRSLSDLRKTLNDEISKVSGQTRELIGVLWKDFAIATTALLSRIALIFVGKTKDADSLGMKVVLMGTAFFLIANLWIILRANTRFMDIAEKSRRSWKNKLFGFIGNEDFETLVDEPIRKSVNAYHSAKALIIVIYALVVVALVGSSFPAKSTAVASTAWNFLLHFAQRLIR